MLRSFVVLNNFPRISISCSNNYFFTISKIGNIVIYISSAFLGKYDNVAIKISSGLLHQHNRQRSNSVTVCEKQSKLQLQCRICDGYQKNFIGCNYSGSMDVPVAYMLK